MDVRGRAHTLSINYRTSQQIRAYADRLLPAAISDVDGNSEGRRGTISVLSGPVPTIELFADAAAEGKTVGVWIADRLKEGVAPDEIAVLVRSPAELRRAKAAVKAGGTTSAELSEKAEVATGCVAIGTMQLAKGLEFRAVAVMACDEDVLPLHERIATVGDDADLESAYETERHLLYVACTRARDHLLVSGVSPGSEFLDDLVQQ